MARFVTDFLPASCPNCGERFKWGTLGTADFFAGAGHTCPNCGAAFEYRRDLDAGEVAQPGPDTDVCDLCDGTGNCPVCGGLGIEAGELAARGCPACGGTGQCQQCGGSGRTR